MKSQLKMVLQYFPGSQQLLLIYLINCPHTYLVKHKIEFLIFGLTTILSVSFYILLVALVLQDVSGHTSIPNLLISIPFWPALIMALISTFRRRRATKLLISCLVSGLAGALLPFFFHFTQIFVQYDIWVKALEKEVPNFQTKVLLLSGYTLFFAFLGYAMNRNPRQFLLESGND